MFTFLKIPLDEVAVEMIAEVPVSTPPELWI